MTDPDIPDVAEPTEDTPAEPADAESTSPWRPWRTGVPGTAELWVDPTKRLWRVDSDVPTGGVMINHGTLVLKDQATEFEDTISELRPVWRNGRWLKRDTFTTTREMARVDMEQAVQRTASAVSA